jgi:histidinol-phosphate aminotransferase
MTAPEPNPHIQAMRAYVPGEQPEGTGWVKLNTNEHPLPPSPRAIAAVQALLAEGAARLRLYPSPLSTPLREAAARLHRHPAAAIVAGNGSDDLLNLLIRAYAGPGRPVGMLDPSYSLYPVLAAAQDAPVVRLPFPADGRLDAPALADCGATVFFLTNPNAPIGHAFSPGEVAAAAARFPGLLVVDEAYAAFADADCAALPAHLPNVVVTRTLSKSHALAGLRAGYALCPPGVAEVLHRVRDSYNLDALAQAAAAAALEDAGWLAAATDSVRAARARLADGLAALGWRVRPSQANFVLADPVRAGEGPSPDAAESALGFLRGRRILVRRFPAHPLTADGLRISVGTPAEVDALLEAAAAWTAGRG